MAMGMIASIVIKSRDYSNMAKRYLTERYGVEFVIGDKIETNDPYTIFKYYASPVRNGNIRFTVQQIYVKTTISPFLPGLYHRAFGDTLKEAVKDFVVENYLKEGMIKIGTGNDIEAAALRINCVMEEVNRELGEYSIGTTKYSPNIVLEIKFDDNIREVSFYSSEIETITDILYQKYLGLEDKQQ